MKRNIAFALVFACLMVQPAFAKGRRAARVTTSEAAPATWETSNDGPTRKFFGVASDTAVTNMVMPALTAMLGLNDRTALQFYLGLSSASPFVFAVGGNIKYSVVGDVTRGLHVGGGVGLGTVEGGTTINALGIRTSSTDFFCNLNGIVGFHFPLVDSVLVNVDSGLTIGIGSGDVDVSIAGHSALFGVSLLYQL